jgi:hypothetical protein
VTAEEKYVAGAYVVIFTAVLVYLLIIALRIARLQRSLAGLETAASAMSSLRERAEATLADAAVLHSAPG